MAILTELFLTFAKIGGFTFGGGYAMIPVIEDICVEKKGWITHEEMMNITVIAEATPGPVAINCATFVGCRCAGFTGAAAATLGVVTPSFLIIFLISLFLDNFLEIALIANAFRGIRIAVGILIADAGLRMVRKLPSGLLPKVIAGAAFAVMLVSDLTARHVSTIAMMLLAGAVGFAACLAAGKGAGK